MNDNSEKRLHEVFFYGLYMDPHILQQQGVKPGNPRIGKADDFELRIGKKATLLRSAGKSAYGMLYSLTHSEINALYWGAGLTEYAPEAILVKAGDEHIAALCCNLVIPPQAGESNEDYKERLITAMNKLDVPVNIP
ncbi:MAG: gamma-glutamylcyclotransferase [Deltaproteobacteria bacterium]|nr:gamma-glutamylcyclotransferase [Deltaproteobacteria bacterium]